jgi:hypothetical protein
VNTYGALCQAFEGASDDLLGVTEAVGGGRVDPVDPVLQRVVDRSDRWLVVLRTPAVLPIPAADRPGAEA